MFILLKFQKNTNANCKRKYSEDTDLLVCMLKHDTLKYNFWGLPLVSLYKISFFKIWLIPFVSQSGISICKCTRSCTDLYWAGCFNPTVRLFEEIHFTCIRPQQSGFTWVKNSNVWKHKIHPQPGTRLAGWSTEWHSAPVTTLGYRLAMWDLSGGVFWSSTAKWISLLEKKEVEYEATGFSSKLHQYHYALLIPLKISITDNDMLK